MKQYLQNPAVGMSHEFISNEDGRTATRATSADIFRIFRQLWGTCTPSVVDEYYQLSEQRMKDGSTQGMVLDRTQITAAIVADTCPHIRVRVRHELYRAATREEPAEYNVIGECDICGDEMDGDDIPEDAEIISAPMRRY